MIMPLLQCLSSQLSAFFSQPPTQRMNSLSLGLAVFLAALCATQALKCHHCVNINEDHPDCPKAEERECGPMLTQCLRVRMHSPAYGEVRKCATQKECDTTVPNFVEKHCCDTDLCN